MTAKYKEETIDFRRVTLEDKPLYDEILSKEGERGCEFSFANVYLWGRHSLAEVEGHIVIFSQFNRKSVYPYPLGTGDKRAAIDAIIADSRARGIPCRISGITDEARLTLESLYPDAFRYHCDEGAFDYVYSIDDLADLPGKKYDGKRNHAKRFISAYPDYTVEPISTANTDEVKAFVDEWYERSLAENPNADFHMERVAIAKALRDREALALEGILIRGGGEVLAMTLGGRLSEDTFDVNFEKARGEIQGAYAIINREFAGYIRRKHPDIRYLDREDDMGLEGLRRAKQSYRPHHMIRKCWACLLEDGYEY